MLLMFGLSYFELKKSIGIKLFYKDILKVLIATFIISIVFIGFRPFIKNVYALMLFSIPVGLLYLVLLYAMKFYRNSDVKILEFFAVKITLLKPFINILKKRVKNKE
jgi:hypothetical protein